MFNSIEWKFGIENNQFVMGAIADKGMKTEQRAKTSFEFMPTKEDRAEGRKALIRWMKANGS